MRSIMITASLCLAASAATAAPELADRQNSMTLSNGCIYAPSTSGQANAWSLKAANGGSAADCAFTVYTMPSFVARAQSSIVSFAPTPSLALQPDYHVGVFR